MNIKEVAALLACSEKQVKDSIESGITLPRTNVPIKLKAEKIRNLYVISETYLEEYISAFEQEEPGRHPPMMARRKLLVEAGHRCAICKDSVPIQFHHMIEFSKLKHHDPEHMLAVCGNCHSKIGRGEIDRKAQDMYKDKLRRQNHLATFENEEQYAFPARFTWHDLEAVIINLHESVVLDAPSDESKYDFTDVQIEQKNKLNNMGKGYFEMMRDHHEPSFGDIEKFLKKPISTEILNLYHEVVDELRSKIAANRTDFDNFEAILLQICNRASDQPELKSKRRYLNTLLSFMYFNCDIGRKV